jgi:hypothetical protein
LWAIKLTYSSSPQLRTLLEYMVLLATNHSMSMP